MNLLQIILENNKNIWILYSIYTIIISTISFLLMYIDKKKAKSYKRRIKESTFVIIAILGGAIGIILSMLILKHKTSKKKFYYLMPFIYLLNRSVSFFILIIN